MGTALAGRCYVASASGYVYGLDGTGQVVWQQRLGSDMVNLVTCSYGRWSLCALDRNGDVWLTTADGRDKCRHVRSGRPTRGADRPVETWRHLICLPDQIIVAGTRTVAAYDPPRP